MSKRRVGRPTNENRANAIFLGERTYQGRTCGKCGGTERYVKGSGCITCMRNYQIEARQVFKASQQNLNSGNELDFLDARGKWHGLSHHVTPLASPAVPEQPIDFLGEDEPTRAVTPNPSKNVKDKKAKVSVELTETAVPGRASKNLNTDPEPLCPQCGCGVEADHESIGGWLRRVSPWRCTICEWQDVNPAPSIDQAAVDTDDFLG